MKHLVVPLALAALSFMQPADAANVAIEGSVAYTISGSQVTLDVERVSNYSDSTTSGTLYLTLWATTSSTPSGSGHELASVSIGQLGPEQYFYNIVRTTGFDAPPDGTYYIHLLLSEYPDLDSYVDHVTFNSQETFGSSGGSGTPGGGGGTPGGDSDLAIHGSIQPVYDEEGYIAEIGFPGMSASYGTVAISNNGVSASGDLKIRMVASDEMYSGGTLTGYGMAEYTLDPLNAGNFYSDFVAYVSPLSTHPDYGRYYTYVLLMERASDGEYYIVDWRGSNSRVTIGCGETSDCLYGDDESDDGGGGGLHPLLLVLLSGLALGAARRRRND